VRVNICGIKKIDPGIKAKVYLAAGPGQVNGSYLAEIPLSPKRHRSETEHRYAQTRISKLTIFHPKTIQQPGEKSRKQVSKKSGGALAGNGVAASASRSLQRNSECSLFEAVQKLHDGGK
jgi:hypothetical protein